MCRPRCARWRSRRVKWARLSAVRRWMPRSRKAESRKPELSQGPKGSKYQPKGGSGSGEVWLDPGGVPGPRLRFGIAPNFVAMHKIDMIKVSCVGSSTKGISAKVIQVDV